ncbi:hypothetical protein [Treponema sp.]|uniref:hypothetical protein n=1 Tax=Treponema sp. TaxID=166 RepID=UPI0025D7A582|nr:hypothetical protein [Treponema sp.]MCR5218997.1 hypothetical protein [Treponema sp.]
MTGDKILGQVLDSYKGYYDVTCDDSSSPFCARAEFHSTNQQYILVKAAKVSQSQSNEYVFFSSIESLNQTKLASLEKEAWETGLSKITVTAGHRNSDISLIVIADRADEEAVKFLKKIRRYKSYCFTFKGWTNFSVVVIDAEKGAFYSNRAGKHLKKFFKNILGRNSAQSIQ